MIEIIAPVLSESVAEGTLTTWCRQEGECVKRNNAIAELETDKVILEIPAPRDGALSNIIVNEGSTVTPAQLLAHLKSQTVIEETITSVTETLAIPSVRPEAQCSGVELAGVAGSERNGRTLKKDVQRVTPAPVIQPERVAEITSVKPLTSGAHQRRREPMLRLRQRIVERLLASRQNNTTLTAFNEVNIQSVMDLRTCWKDRSAKRYGVELGFMSFFVRTVTWALERFPTVNVSVDGNEVIWHDYCDIGIAVNGNHGLVVPVLRSARSLLSVEIERQVAEHATQTRDGKLPLEALQGSTFSITNGGTSGSMMSVPIINPPQLAILGVYAITPHPVAENSQAVIRPVMYLALSYDHRIIDSQEAVQTLVAVRKLLESPERLLLDL